MYAEILRKVSNILSSKIQLYTFSLAELGKCFYLFEWVIILLSVKRTSLAHGKGISLFMEAEKYSKDTSLVVLPTSHYK